MSVTPMKLATRVQVLTCGDPVRPERRRRYTLEVGDSMMIGRMLVILIRDGDTLWLDLYLADGTPQCAVPLRPFRPGCLAPQHSVIPRAIHFDHHDRPTACLLEIQYHGMGRPCWDQPPAMEGHHAKPNHPPKGV